jgi:hypothetical protein
VTNKARFIAQILDNDSPARVYEDMDEKVLTYAEIQAVAAGKKEIKQRIETANTLAEMYMLRREWGHEKAEIRECLEYLPPKLEKAQETLTKIQADNEIAKKLAEKDLKAFPFTNEQIQEKVLLARTNYENGIDEPIKIGTVAGFDIAVFAYQLSVEAEEVFTKMTIKGNSDYECYVGTDENENCLLRLRNVFENAVPSQEKMYRKEVEQHTQNIEQAKSQIDIPFEHEDEIIRLEKLLKELDDELSGASKQEDVYDDPEDEETALTAKEKAERERLDNTDDRDYEVIQDDDPPPRGRSR